MNNVKHILLVAVVVIGTLLVIGWIGHQDYQTEIMQAVVTTCESSGGPSDTKAGWVCQSLIREVQKDGRHEVLTDGTRYWVEEK